MQYHGIPTGKRIKMKTAFASKMQSLVSLRPSRTWIVSAAVCKIKMDTARGSSRNPDLELVSNFVQPMVIHGGFTVLVRGERW